MSYTGNAPAEQYISTVKDTFNGDGSTTDFTLSRTALANNLEVFVENVQQEPTTAYTVSGTTLSFTSAPVSGTGNIYVIHRGQAVQTIVPPAGISLNATDATITNGLTVDNDGATVATFDRATSDGTIAEFQKDGTAVGAVGTTGGDLTIYSSPASHIGLRFAQGTIFPTDNTGTNSDANIDLGFTTNRFKDMWLSGGVYLGGTGSANKLTDYEEGTWTPTYQGSSTAGTVSYVSRGGTYTKIGNQVTCWFSLVNFSVSGASGGVTVTGLPFQSSFSNNVRGAYSGNVRMYNVNLDNDREYVNVSVDGGTSFIGLLQWTDDGAWIAQPVDNSSVQYIEGYVTYTVA